MFFGFGTIGRDMFYALEANAMIYFLSNVLDLPLGVYVAASLVFTVLRVFDAINDPFMGLIVDNWNSRWGKFKPPMLIGALIAGLCYIVLFTDFGLRNYWFVVVFALAYLLWDVSYGLNDIAYWSMIPSLSVNQKVREKISAFARICANVGMFAVMVGWEPITSSFSQEGSIFYDNPARGWFWFAVVVTVLMILFQLFTIFGVKEKRGMFIEKEEHTTLKDMWRVLTKNDQLLWTTLAMSLFTIGYMTSTTIAIYYMQYVFGDANMYAVLAAAVGVAQLSALAVFPSVSKHFSREKLYLLATLVVMAGYLVFLFADTSLVLIIVAALLLFVGEAFIQLLMLLFLEDTVEYGQWKLGQRNESITLSVQPLINKIGGAVSMGLVSMALIWSGIKTGDTAAVAIDDSGKLVIKLVMMVVPMIVIIAGYIVYRCKFKINKEMYDRIITDLSERGELDLNKDSLAEK